MASVKEQMKDTLIFNHINNLKRLIQMKEQQDEGESSKDSSIDRAFRVKKIKQRGVGENRKFKSERFDMVSVSGSVQDLRSKPLLVFRNPIRELEIRNIINFVKIDNKTIGYKEEVRYDMTWAQALELNTEAVDLDEDHHALIRFQFEDGFQHVWGFLETFLGGYLLDAANQADREKEEYPEQLLEWPKEYESWADKVEQVKALCFSSDESELPTLAQYEAMTVNAASCYNSVDRGGWDLELPHEYVSAYNEFVELVGWEKARLGGYWKGVGAAIDRKCKREIVGQFERVMGNFILLLTAADL